MGLRRQALEPDRVHPVGGDPQDVARRFRDDDPRRGARQPLGLEDAAQVRHVRLQRDGRRAGR
jgi:hypothetical protein